MAAMTEAVPQERARKISVVDTLDNARRALSTHRQWLQRRLSVEEEFGLGYSEPESRDTTEDRDRQWTVADIEDLEEQKSEAITLIPRTPPSIGKKKKIRKTSKISPSPALDSLIEEEEISTDHRVDWATTSSTKEDEDSNESLQESPKSKRPKMKWGMRSRVSPALISSSPSNTHTTNNTIPSNLDHIFTSTQSSNVATEIASESETADNGHTFTSAWGSLSSLDNYMESLENNEQPIHPVETAAFPAPEFATTSAVLLYLSSSDDDSSDNERDSILHNLQKQQLPDIASLKSRSAPKSPCGEHRGIDIPSSRNNITPTPPCEQEGEEIDIAALQSKSVATILPVVPAPKDKQSSYEIHQYSKLEQVGKGLRVIEVKDRDHNSQLEATDHHMKLVLGQKIPMCNTSNLETVVEDVLPYKNSDSTSTTDETSHTAEDTGSDIPGHNLNSSQASLPTLSAVDKQHDIIKDSGCQGDALDDTRSKEELTKHVQDDISFNPRVTSTPAPGFEAEQKGQGQESSDQKRRQILENLQLPPLKENRIGGARSILSRLPRLKSTTPTSPTNTGISTDLKLSRKRYQELPSYTTHHCRMAGSQAFNPPCPQYGVKQPEEKIPQRKRLYSAPSINPLPSPHTSPLRHKKMSVHTPITRKRYSSTGSPLLLNKSFDGSSNTLPVSPVMKTIKRPSSAKERRKHPPLRHTVSGPTLTEPEDKIHVLRRRSAGVVSPLLRAQTSSDGGLTKTDCHRGSIVSLYQMHSGPGPLHLSAKSGNLRQLQYLLSEGENVDVRDHEGRTPLMYCIHSKGVHLSCASLLIQEGASLDKQASDGSTVIHLAAAVGAISLIELAIINQADPDIRDFEGRLPLHWSTMMLQSSKCAALLLKHSKLDINAVDDAGMTSLMWAAYNNNPLVTAFLLSKGAECEEKDMDGMTAMHWAVHQEGAKCLELLLKSDHTYFKDHKGRTVLHLSAEVGCMAACELVLLGLRSDAVHDLDRMGRTPLHYAAACSRVDVCALLLDRGSDASLKDLTGKTAIEYARRKMFDYVVALLMCHGTAVADFARVSMSNSISSLLNQTTSFSELSAVSDEEVPDIITESLQPVTTNKEPIGDVVTHSTASATSLYRGAFLGRFVQDKNDPLQHFFFWLTEQGSKSSLLQWSRKCDKHRPQQATVYEVHGGPSKSLRQKNPAYSADELHQHVFWILTDCGIFDMLAYNETAYETWIGGLGKIACGVPETMVGKTQNDRELQPGKKMFGKRSASVAPALVVDNEAVGSSSSVVNDSSRKDDSHGYNSDSEEEFRSTPGHTPTTIATTTNKTHQPTKLQGSPQNDIDDII